MEMLKYKISRLYKKIRVECSWLLYKYFHITRSTPCGRIKNKDNYLCCLQPLKKERVYLSEDKKHCYCKVCNRLRIMANYEIDPHNPWRFK